MDRGRYRPESVFSDGYFDWLDSKGLLCADDSIAGYQSNRMWVGLPAIHHSNEAWARETIEHALGTIAECGGLSEADTIYFTAPSGVAPDRYKAIHLRFINTVNEGVCRLAAAGWRIQRQEWDLALHCLFDATVRLGAAYGMAHGMNDETARRARSARKAADALHSSPGGSRAKQEAIRKAWASGNFTSRDICAEQQCAALGMSLSAARKALRNTPNPT
jgi:hypothetical protein